MVLNEVVKKRIFITSNMREKKVFPNAKNGQKKVKWMAHFGNHYKR